MSELSNDLQNKKKGLGRGLGSLLGGAQPAVSNTNIQVQEHVVGVKAQSQVTTNIPMEARVWNIAIDKLQASEYQPRTQFEKESLEELANSIKEKGVIQPLVVRKKSDSQYEIIAGERRWRAAQIAGLHEVPAIIKTLSNKETLEIAIIENIQRENLNPIEEAEAYGRLLNEFQLTQQQVSEKVGKDRATVANVLRLLGLPGEIKEMLSNSSLSAGHAKVILGLEDSKKMVQLAKKIIQNQLSVRATEKEVSKLKSPKTVNNGQEESVETRSADRLAEDLQRALGTKVKIDSSKGKGKITIHFYSNDELSEISERIISACTK